MTDYVTQVAQLRPSTETIANPPGRICNSIRVMAVLLVLLAPSWSSARALEEPADGDAAPSVSSTRRGSARYPAGAAEDQAKSFASSLRTAIKTIGEDEWHIIKSPFSRSAP